MSEIVSIGQAIGRTPELIAAEINDIKDKTRRLVLYNSIEIGRRLLEAKELLHHGEWSEWLEKSVDYSQSTANNLMRIFKEYGAEQMSLLGDNLKSQAFANLAYTQALALLGIPEEERENFIKENKVEDLSTRELQKLIKERDKAIKEKEEALKKAEKYKNGYEEKQEETQALLETLKVIESDKTLSEIELKEAKEKIGKLKEELEEASESENSEEVERLQSEIQSKENEIIEFSKKIEDLEQKLKEKPIEVLAQIPEDITKELEELRAFKEKNANDSKVILEYKINFSKTVDTIKTLLKSLNEIKNESEEEYIKYKKAASGLINKILETL